MTGVFLAAPLDDPRLLGVLLGKAPAPPPLPATLVGHEMRVDAAGLRPVLVAAPGAEAGGAIVSCSGRALERVGFVMAAFGARRVEVELAGASKVATFVAEASGAKVLAMANQAGARTGTESYVGFIDYDVRQVADALRAP